ncbi:right-handed parallel beta-helix repeat-containing protein [Priestia aryabhattai]
MNNIKKTSILFLMFLLIFILYQITEKNSNNNIVKVSEFKAKYNEKDDTGRIQRAINYAVKHNYSTVKINRGNYDVSSPLILSKAKNVSIIGNGAKINFTSNLKSVKGDIKAFVINNCSDVTIKRLTINIVNEKQEYTGIHIASSNNIVLHQVNINKAGWIGIAISDDLTGNSQGITINNCRVEHCRVGIWSNGNFVKIMNKTLVSNHWSTSTERSLQGQVPIWENNSTYYDGIIIKGEHWVIKDCLILDNGQSGIYSGETKNGLISNNIIKGNWNKGIDLGASKSNKTSSIQFITIENNKLQDNKTGQIHLSNVDNSIVMKNDALVLDTTYEKISTYAQPAIILNKSCVANIIKDNSVLQNYENVAGIFVNSTGFKSSRNIIEHNEVSAKLQYNIDSKANTLVR